LRLSLKPVARMMDYGRRSFGRKDEAACLSARSPPAPSGLERPAAIVKKQYRPIYEWPGNFGPYSQVCSFFFRAFHTFRSLHKHHNPIFRRPGGPMLLPQSAWYLFRAIYVYPCRTFCRAGHSLSMKSCLGKTASSIVAMACLKTKTCPFKSG
jgi:hypothetical protein